MDIKQILLDHDDTVEVLSRTFKGAILEKCLTKHIHVSGMVCDAIPAKDASTASSS